MADLPQPVEIEPLALGDLPLVTWPKPPRQADALTAASLPPAPEVVIDTMGRDYKPDDSTLVRVTLQNQKLAWIQVGRNEGAVMSGNQGGVTVMCGSKAANSLTMVGAPVAARWETLAAAPGAGLTYTVVQGWFDVSACKLRAVTRTSVTALPILHGRLFAFREACTDCAHSQAVTLLGPRLVRVAAGGMGGDTTTTQGAWSRVTLPVRRGGVGSFLARLSSFDLQNWAAACGLPALSGSAAPELLVGVEISQAVSDPHPTAVAFVSAFAPRT